MRYDLNDLKLFVAIVEAGSITHGAREANLALPSASARLRGMEEAIAIPLLTRNRRGVTPTPAGEALLHHARIVLKQVQQMRGELGDYAKGLKAQITLLANTAATSEFLPAALAPFLAGHPNIDIDLKERQSSDIIKALRYGLADIGIVSDASDSSGLETLPFADDQLVVALPKGHRLSDKSTIFFKEIVSEQFVGLMQGSALQDYLSMQAERLGKSMSFRIRLPNFSSLLEIVDHKVGIAIVPERAAQGKDTIPLGDEWAKRRLLLCVRKRDELSTQARILLQQLEDFYR